MNDSVLYWCTDTGSSGGHALLRYLMGLVL